MSISKTVVSLVVSLFVCTAVSADTRVILIAHVDGYTIGDQNTPPKDEEHVYWIAENRLRMDLGSHTFIVRRDLGKLYFVDHVDQSFFELGLPIVHEKVIPPDIEPQLLEMLSFDAEVTATEEFMQILGRSARGYDVVMTSPVIRINNREWTTTEVPFEPIHFHLMFEQVLKLQISMDDYLEESKKMEGFIVATTGTMDMPTINLTGVGTSTFTKQIDTLDPPAGTYDPPVGYTKKPFDFMAMFQRLQ